MSNKMLLKVESILCDYPLLRKNVTELFKASEDDEDDDESYDEDDDFDEEDYEEDEDE